MSICTRFVLALLCVGCASTKIKTPVRSVKVQGNEAFGDKTIVNRLATRPPQGLIFKTAEEFDPIALELDRKRVESFYHERGYFDAHVTDLDVQKAGKGVRVTIQVEEGEPTRIAEIELTGTETDYARSVLARRSTAVRPGKILDHPEYLLAKDALQQALADKGYAHAEVDGVVEVDREAHRAEVRLDIDPGPLVHFGKVTVEGLKRVPESAVRNRIAWDEGDRFSPDLLDKTEGRLYSLGLFSSVRADFDREGRPAVVNVVVKVSEGAHHEVRFGVGAGVDRARWELRTRGGYTQHGIFDSPLTTLRLDATPGYSWLRSEGGTNGPSIEASANLQRHDIFRVPRLAGNALAAYDREPREGYTLSGPRLNLALEYPFVADDFNVSFGWEIQYLDFVAADPMVFSGEAIAARLAFYQQRAVLDLRDVPLDARRGLFAMVTTEEGGIYAGGQVPFFRIQADVRGYVPLFPRLTLAGRLYGGKLSRFGDGETPLTMRFYGGGGTQHRGFGFRRLAPMRRGTPDNPEDPMSVGDAIPIGGAESVLVSTEARLDLFKFKKQWFSSVLFLDAGDVTEAGMMDLGNLHYAAGLGLRYDTLIGPVRVDVAYRLNRTAAVGPEGLGNPDPASSFAGKIAFHLSLGEAF